MKKYEHPKDDPIKRCKQCHRRLKRRKKFCSNSCSRKFYGALYRVQTPAHSEANKRYRQLGQDERQKLIDSLGGKCQKCGYNKCLQALHFHHRDPTQKKMSLAASHLLSKEKREMAWEEVKKCDLLCSNCHMEIHYLD